MSDQEDPDSWWSDTQAILLEPQTVPDPEQPDPDPAAEWFHGTAEELEPAAPLVPRRAHYVTAVVVSHEGSTWLPAVLTTLAAQTRPVDRAFGVDTGSADDCAAQLRRALGADRVLQVDSGLGFGQAAAAALELAGPPAFDVEAEADVVQWVWLLHDDSAPNVTCLEQLLATADDHPDVAILGPKILGWHDRRLLLEVGFSITGSGRRFTGLERGEHDQGQHDGVREVLAVSSAGMLVRRDIWDGLRGFDPELPLFRDDLDFCWRAWRSGQRVLVATDAVIHHREASAHGRRASEPMRVHRADREAGAHVLLSHVVRWAGPLLAIRLIVGSATRALMFVIGKDFASARDEIGAVLDIALHPGALGDSRELITATSTAPGSVVRDLRPRFTWQLRQAAEAALAIASTSNTTADVSLSAIESGPVDDDAAYTAESGPGWLSRIVRRPGFLLFSALALVSVWVTRGAWLGDGSLQGGALLPTPTGAGDLWSAYVQAWHDVGPGSSVPSAPYLLAIWLLSTVLLGKAWLAVNLLVLLAIPFAGWAAYFSLRGVIVTRWIRIAAAVAYAFLPAVTGAISAGRIGTTIVAILLPFVVRSCVRIVQPSGTIRRAAGTALLMAVVISCVPGLWLLGIVLAIAASVWLWLRQRRAALHVIGRVWFAVAFPFVLLLPWSVWLVTHPAAFFFEAGISSPGLTDPQINAVDVLLMHPGGPGMTPIFTTVGLVLAGLLALLRRDRRIMVLGAWLVGLVALAFGVLQTVWVIAPPSSTTAMRPWPGPATLLFGMSMIGAAAIGADGLRRRMSRANFNLMQPIAAVVGVIAIAAPVLVLVFWAPDATSLLVNGPRRMVPAFVAAEAVSSAAPRTLVLTQESDGGVRYTLVNGGGQMIGDADASPPAAVWEPIDTMVGYLASGRGGNEIAGLAAYGIRYVLLARGSEQGLVAVLDGESGLRRLSTSGGEVLWRISGVTSRARTVVDGQVEAMGIADGGDPTSNPFLATTIGPSGGERALVLGQTPDAGWRARTLGTATNPSVVLEPTQASGANGWSQGFALPQTQADVEVRYDGSLHGALLWLQAVAVAITVIMALPSRRAEVDLDADGDPA